MARGLFRWTVVVSALLAPIASAQDAGGFEALFAPTGSPERPGGAPTVIREQPVGIDFGALRRTRLDSVVTLEFFDDAAFIAHFDREHERPAAWRGLGATWSGTLPEDGGWFVLTLQRGVVSANLWTGDGRAFQIRTGQNGEPVAQELDLARLDPCGGVLTPAGGWNPGVPRGGACAPDDGSFIDVLINYTPEARFLVGGVAQIEGMAANAVASANISYENSGINPRLRLVGVAEVEYTEADAYTSLIDLTDPNDGRMDEAHDQRDEAGADLVALLVGNVQDACGIAWLMNDNSPDFASHGFSVTRYDCAVGGLTFAHELGHNQGACHARSDGGGCENGGLYPYSVGHRFFGDSGTQWRTLMAYAPGFRLPHFSNPGVIYDGAPTGVPVGQSGPSHNTRTLNETACAVANFRESTQQCPAAPPAPLIASSNCVGATITREGTPPENESWYWQGASCGERTDLGSGETYAAGLGTYYIRALNEDTGCWSGDCASVAVVGPTTEWEERAAAGPSPRSSHAMAYDSARGRAVLFGGWDWDQSKATGDTWEWNGSAWALRSAPGPSPRVSHAMAYDSARGRVVLFGGFAGAHFGDTWEWDGSSWVLRATTGPSPRSGHAMAYDSARQRTVLFGGAESGETWEWNGSSWSLRATTGPSARTRHAMAFDAARGRVVLFGGFAGAHLGDTWEWDGSDWSPRSTGGPARAGHAMAFDESLERVVLFGGWANAVRGDTWQWDGTSWALRNSDGPVPRESHAMVYDTARGRVVAFGGYDDGPFIGYDDTWELPSPACGCPADFDQNGEPTVADFSAFRAAYLASDPRADFNSDGAYSVSDFSAFRSAYLAGCP